MKKRLLSLLLALSLAFCLAPFALAEEVPAAADVPSSWAQTDIYIAGVYGLYSPELAGWTKPVTAADCAAVINALGTSSAAFSESPTRGEVLNGLSALIAAQLKVTIAPDAVSAYFTDNGLLTGRLLPDGTIDLALDAPATAQETVILAKRVYEHIRYALGEDSKGVLWKVSDEDNTVYLLGSVHMLTNDSYPFSKSIMDAWKESEVLVEELDLTDMQALINALGAYAVFTDGRKLSDAISAETYEAYKKFWTAQGFAEADFETLQPWYAASDLSNWLMLPAFQSGKLNTTGADVFFTSIRGTRPIIALETADFQYGLLSGMGPEYDEAQILALLDTIADEEASAAFLDELYALINAWRTGDADKLTELAFTDYDALAKADPENAAAYEFAAEFSNKLFALRNDPMSAKIKTFLTEDKTNDYFVVVGAGHMIDPDTGIVKQLTDAGYTVERVA